MYQEVAENVIFAVCLSAQRRSITTGGGVALAGGVTRYVTRYVRAVGRFVSDERQRRGNDPKNLTENLTKKTYGFSRWCAPFIVSLFLSFLVVGLPEEQRGDTPGGGLWQCIPSYVWKQPVSLGCFQT